MAGNNVSDSTNRDAVAGYLAAIAEFGDPDTVTAAFGPEPAAGASLTRVLLAGRAARRCPATRATLT